MRISKTTRYLAEVGKISVLAGVPLLVSPQAALADDWITNVMDTSAQQVGEENAGTATGDSVATTVSSVAKWIIGMTIVLFVLKVILTAVDRMLLSSPEAGDSVLVRLPVIGAYPMVDPGNPGKKGYEWKNIWILFFIQLLVCAGVWFFIDVIIGLISALLGRV